MNDELSLGDRLRDIRERQPNAPKLSEDELERLINDNLASAPCPDCAEKDAEIESLRNQADEICAHLGCVLRAPTNEASWSVLYTAMARYGYGTVEELQEANPFLKMAALWSRFQPPFPKHQPHVWIDPDELEDEG